MCIIQTILNNIRLCLWETVSCLGNHNPDSFGKDSLAYYAFLNVSMTILSISYTRRWRSLCDLHYQGPQAMGGVRSIETRPRCVTNLYHGL